MGTLYYGSARTPIELDDRALAHVESVVIAKLRRKEGFAMTIESPGLKPARRVFWLREGVDLEFAFDDAAPVKLNRLWVDAISATANGGQGLRLVAEPAG